MLSCYGNTDDIVKGHGYNSEMKDSSGLIYLRARYYDLDISRFVQIDNNYDGEKESIASQNKYVYTLNNPYKYVDRNGNIPFKSPFTICRPKLPIKNKPVKILPKVKKELAKKEQPLPKIETGISKNKASIKGGGSVTKKPAPRNIVISADCPEKATLTPIRVVSTEFEHVYDIGSKDIGGGPFSLKIGKKARAKYKLNSNELRYLNSVGFSNNIMNFNINIDGKDIDTLLGSYGFDFSFGSWGALIFSFSSKTSKSKISLEIERQTINIFANDSISMIATTIVNQYIEVDDYFKASYNKYLAAAIGIVIAEGTPVLLTSFGVTAKYIGDLLLELLRGSLGFA